MKKLLLATAMLGLTPCLAHAIPPLTIDAAMLLNSTSTIDLTPSGNLSSATTAVTIDSSYTPNVLTVGDASHGITSSSVVSLTPNSGSTITLPTLDTGGGYINLSPQITLQIGTIVATLTYYISSLAPIGPLNSEHVDYDGTVTSDTASTSWVGYIVNFQNFCTQSASGGALTCLDHFSIVNLPSTPSTPSTPSNTVPEPLSLALFSSGLLGLAAMRRRS